MADYQFDSILVADPVTFQRAANASVTVYDVADTGNATPLQLKDLNGLPLTNPLTSSPDAFLPAFTTTSPQVKLVAGTLAVAQASYKALLDEARAAKEFVQGIGVAGTTTGEAGTRAGATIDAGGQFAFTIPKGDTGAKGDKGEPGVWTPEFQAQQQGFWPVYSDTPPAHTEMYGVPVLWLKPTGLLTDIPQVPPQPLWDNTKQQYMIPSGVVGILYKDAASGQVLSQGTIVPAPASLPSKVNVKAEAQPGYTTSAPFVWQHWFPNPTIKTLALSDDFTGPDGTVLGGRAFNNALGGTAARSWTKYSSSTPDSFAISGNGIAPSGSTRNWYWCDLGFSNVRLEFEITATGTRNAVIGIGGRPPGQPGSNYGLGIVGLFVGSDLKLAYTKGDGGTKYLISQTMPANPLGTYVLELFESQLGFQKPGDTSMTYFDLSYVSDSEGGLSPSRRGSCMSIDGGSSIGTPVVLDNMKIFNIGGL